MQKLKSEIVKKILYAKLTQSEIANLLLIGKMQDEWGRVRGVHYKYVCEKLNLCNQTFYNAKRGLEEKGFITTEKNHLLDVDFKITNNENANKKLKEGYIDLQMKLFDEPEFYKLAANEMAMALDFLRIRFNESTKRQGLDTKELIKTYKDCFGVTERSVRNYLHNLRKFFNINLFNHEYYISIKKKWEKDRTPGHEVEEAAYREHVAACACKRAKASNLTTDVIRDISGLIKQYGKTAAEGCKDISTLIIKAVFESIENQNKEEPKRKWIYKLSVPYVHLQLRSLLGLQNEKKEYA